MSKYVTRYGAMRSIGVFAQRGKPVDYRRGDRVVARTPRGLEVGEILCQGDDEDSSQDHGEILRRMTANDVNEWTHIESKTQLEFQTCCDMVREMSLPMELVDIEHLFGGERIVIYYLAESRVDFRALVRQLAKEFQTRIEMRQIGVRDEAKLLADYGDCGKPVCCNTHLSQMPPVSMKMAKIQKATLDPTKISGRCGRLKCCLRYEYDTYQELARQLPPIGSHIVTRSGAARVLGHEIIAEQVLVETEDHRRVLIDVVDVLSVIRGSQRSSRKPPSPAVDDENE